MATLKLVISDSKTSVNGINAKLLYGDRYMICERLGNYLARVCSGNSGSGSVVGSINDSAVAATGTVTCATTVAGNTVTVGSVTLTGVASGATGPQFNIGGTDTITAANIAAAINAQTTLQPHFSATSSSTVVTITCLDLGTVGNMAKLTSSGSTVAVTAFSGGTDAPVTTVTF